MSKRNFLFSFFLIFSAVESVYSIHPLEQQILSKPLPKAARKDASIQSLRRGQVKEMYCDSPVTTFQGKTIPGSRVGQEIPLSSLSQTRLTAIPVGERFTGRPFYRASEETSTVLKDCDIGLSFHFGRNCR